MMDMTPNSPFTRGLLSETWGLWALGIIFVILRTAASLKRYGFRGLLLDDYIMWFAVLWYTLLIIGLNITACAGGSNLYLPGEYETFSEEDIRQRIRNGKLSVATEQAMLMVIYVLKACMLLVYKRLTLGLTHAKYVKLLSIFVACGFVASEIAFFTTCKPFRGRWAMPPPEAECATLVNYAIIQAVFNISSDFFMLAISIPLLLSTGLALKQKLALVVIFGMGIFVILSAILTKAFNLSDVYSSQYMFWYAREASTAVYVTNLPLIWPLLRETFPVLRSFTPGAMYDKATSSKRYGNEQIQSTSPKTTTRINVKSATTVSVVERGFELSGMSRRRGEGSVSIDSDERALYNQDHGRINQFTTVEIDDSSVRDIEAGPINETTTRCWGTVPEDASMTSRDEQHAADTKW